MLLPLPSPFADGSLGDMLFFHAFKSPGLVVDIVEDIRLVNLQALKAAPRKTGAIILGGGACRHPAAAVPERGDYVAV